MKNEAVAHRLYEIADYLEMQDVEYKPRAYRKAARQVESLSEPIEDLHDRGALRDVEGIGESIAGKIEDYLETGEMDYYQQLREELPLDIEAITSVEGVGPKTAKKLYRELDVTTLDELEEAAEAGEIADVEGFGEKTQQNILDHIEQARRQEERTLIGRAFPRAEATESWFEESDEFDRATVVGSFRRRRPTVGDLDVLTTVPDDVDRMEAMESFCDMDDVTEVLATGETKTSVVVEGGLRIDVRIVDADEYGAALVYFTGSKDHNIEIRDRAMGRDWKLNEYGLFDLSERSSAEQSDADASDDVSDVEDGSKRAGERLAGETEEGVYDRLDLEWIPPELRENTGEVDAAAAGDLPDLVETDDVRGDLQMHTTYSDGDASVREMAEAAAERGHDYVLVTDHGPAIAVTGGVDADDIEEQREEVETANDEVDTEVLLGVEAEVTDGGDLDVPDAVVDEVDMLVAACHNPTDSPTEDVCGAMETYPIDVLAHPLNRKINEREPLDLDLQQVVHTAAEQNVALEINSQPERLDLDWASVKEYRDDAQFVVSTDAHSTDELDLLHLGVSQARRGWLEPDDVLNTRSLAEVRDWLGR